VATRWMLISEAWSLNELALKVGDALIALTLLKLSKLQGLAVEESEEELRRRVLAVRPVLHSLLREAKAAAGYGYSSPLLKALQREYGYADPNRVSERLRRALEALERVGKGEYRKEDFEELERILECVAYEASQRSQELVAMASRS